MINTIRVICNKKNTSVLKKKLKEFFCEYEYTFFNFVSKEYWKEPNMDEITIYLSPSPILTLEEWGVIYRGLFNNQEYEIEHDTDGICFCSYVSGWVLDNPNIEAYFVIFGIQGYRLEDGSMASKKKTVDGSMSLDDDQQN